MNGDNVCKLWLFYMMYKRMHSKLAGSKQRVSQQIDRKLGSGSHSPIEMPSMLGSLQGAEHASRRDKQEPCSAGHFR